MKTLLQPPSSADFICLLRAWRFWLLGALLGGLLGAAAYTFWPPAYRARATLVVSFNLEKTWPNKPDNELFYYLERESRKLEEVAWADATLQLVAQQTGFSVAELRAGKLELSQPQDGGWNFYASDPSAKVAGQLAAAWAQAFNAQTLRGIENAVALDAARKALQTHPGDAELQSSIQALESSSLAITPEMQISLAQTSDLPTQRKTSLGVYSLAGAALLLCLAALGVLLIGTREYA